MTVVALYPDITHKRFETTRRQCGNIQVSDYYQQLAEMKLSYLCLMLAVFLCLVITDAYPFRSGNIDYLEALRRMQQIPQWHCMRYRRFQLHGHCNRWLMMRRN